MGKTAKVVIGFLVSIIGISVALYLLLNVDKFTGAEFVALTLGFAFIGLIIIFSAEVQEFSIVGNVVRLKELKSEASRAIDELKQAKIELFRLLIHKSIHFSGGWGSSSKVDERVGAFCNLYEQVEKFCITEELKNDINKVLKVLLKCQYGNLIIIHETSIEMNFNYSELDSPQDLYIKLNDQMIDSLINRMNPKQNFLDVKKDVIDGINAYAKLYVIQIKMNDLEIN